MASEQWTTRSNVSGLDQAAHELRISPRSVRYIKLGETGRWERDCETRGILRIGFGTEDSRRYAQCMAGDWEAVEAAFVAEGKSHGVATDFTRQLRHFFEDDASTLWITFIGERLCWAFIDGSPPEIDPSGEGSFRRVKAPWSDRDLSGEALVKDRLSGAVSKVVGYRGTICSVDVAEYVVRRINGEKSPEVERTLAARSELQNAVLLLIGQLRDKDFELLVDLVFTTSGWRRVGAVGGTQKTKDIALELPSTGERAFVQVKSKTSQAELEDYIGALEERGPYGRMFFVYHAASSSTVTTDDARVVVIGPDRLAELVLDAGLVNWVIEKVS